MVFSRKKNSLKRRNLSEKYEIKWIYEDGTEISGASSEAFKGFSPLFKYLDGSTLPLRVSTDQSKIYEFDKKFAYVDKSGKTHEFTYEDKIKCEDIALAQDNGANITIVVKFKEVLLNKVTFNYGEKYTQFVATGIRVNYNGPKPIKESTAIADYEFVGWKLKGSDDSDIVEMPYKVETDGDVEFIPVFKVISKYTVSFNVNGEVTSTIYEAGESVVVPSYVEKDPTLNSYYEFVGWKANNAGAVLTEIPNASANVTYYACYEEHAIVNGAQISLDNGVLNVKVLGSSQVNLSKLFDLMENGYEIYPICIKFGNVNVDLSEAQVRQAISKGVDKISYSLSSIPEMKFKLIVKSGPNYINNIVAKVTLSDIEDANNLRAYVSESEINLNVVSNNEISFSATSNSDVIFSVFYRLKLDCLAPVTYKVNGEFVDSNTIFEFGYGESVTIEIIPNVGIDLMNVLAIDQNNEVIKSIFGDKITLVISDNTNIVVDTKKQVYTITYMVDDQVYLAVEAAYGSKIQSPIPFKTNDGEVSYQFVGWDKEINTVTENVVLHAIFKEILPENNEKPLSEGKIVYTKLIALIIIAICGLGFVIGLLLVLRRKKNKIKNKKKKQQKRRKA